MSNKLIVKNSVFLYVRLIVTMFVGIFTSRFVLSALGASDYGLYNVVGGIVSMMAIVNTMMVTTTYRFLAYEEGKPDGDVNKVFNMSFSLHIAAAIIILILAVTIGVHYIANFLVVAEGKLSDAYFVFAFSVINILADVLGTPFRGLLIANEKFAITVPIEIGTKVLVLGVAILLNYVPGNHLRYYAALITLVHCVNPISYAIYSINKYYDTVKWKFHKKISEYRAMFSFTGWNMLEVAATIGEGQGSAIIINRFFGTILNASFGVARQLNSAVNMFSQGLGQAVVPQITKSYSAGDHERSSHLVIMASKYSFFLMAIPMLPILLEADFILGIWLKEVPVYTAIFVRAMLIRSVIKTSQYGIGPLIHASGDIKLFKIFSSVIMLSALPIAYFSYKAGHPAYMISYIYILTGFLEFIVNLILMRYVLNYDVKEFLSKSISKILGVSMLQIPVFYLASVLTPGVPRFFIICILSEMVLFASVYFIGLNKYEKETIIGHVKQFTSKYFSKDALSSTVKSPNNYKKIR